MKNLGDVALFCHKYLTSEPKQREVIKNNISTENISATPSQQLQYLIDDSILLLEEAEVIMKTRKLNSGLIEWRPYIEPSHAFQIDTKNKKISEGAKEVTIIPSEIRAKLKAVEEGKEEADEETLVELVRALIIWAENVFITRIKDRETLPETPPSILYQLNVIKSDLKYIEDRIKKG